MQLSSIINSFLQTETVNHVLTDSNYAIDSINVVLNYTINNPTSITAKYVDNDGILKWTRVETLTGHSFRASIEYDDIRKWPSDPAQFKEKLLAEIAAESDDSCEERRKELTALVLTDQISFPPMKDQVTEDLEEMVHDEEEYLEEKAASTLSDMAIELLYTRLSDNVVMFLKIERIAEQQIASTSGE